MKNFWMQTHSGRKLVLADPNPEQITLEDIAHHLSHICRFSGATREFYSVAQHSCLVAANVPAPLGVQALLHDAAEAYLGDVIWPLKQLLPEYKVLEKRMTRAVFEAMGEGLSLLPEGLWLDPRVLHADQVVLATEKRDVMLPTEGYHPDLVWQALPAPLDATIRPMPPEQAREHFLAAWDAHHLRRRIWESKKGDGDVCER